MRERERKTRDAARIFNASRYLVYGAKDTEKGKRDAAATTWAGEVALNPLERVFRGPWAGDEARCVKFALLVVLFCVSHAADDNAREYT